MKAKKKLVAVLLCMMLIASSFTERTVMAYTPGYEVQMKNYVKLKLPYKPNQGTKKDCWACAVATIYQYRYGKAYKYKKGGKTYYNDDAYVHQYAGGKYDASKSIYDVCDMLRDTVDKKYAKVYWVVGKYNKPPTFDAVKKNIDAKYPMYISMDGEELDKKGNVIDKFGHAAVIYGYDCRNGDKYIYVYLSNGEGSNGTGMIVNYSKPTNTFIFPIRDKKYRFQISRYTGID